MKNLKDYAGSHRTLGLALFRLWRFSDYEGWSRQATRCNYLEQFSTAVAISSKSSCRERYYLVKDHALFYA